MLTKKLQSIKPSLARGIFALCMLTQASYSAQAMGSALTFTAAGFTGSHGSIKLDKNASLNLINFFKDKKAELPATLQNIRCSSSESLCELGIVSSGDLSSSTPRSIDQPAYSASGLLELLPYPSKEKLVLVRLTGEGANAIMKIAKNARQADNPVRQASVWKSENIYCETAQENTKSQVAPVCTFTLSLNGAAKAVVPRD